MSTLQTVFDPKALDIFKSKKGPNQFKCQVNSKQWPNFIVLEYLPHNGVFLNGVFSNPDIVGRCVFQYSLEAFADAMDVLFHLENFELNVEVHTYHMDVFRQLLKRFHMCFHFIFNVPDYQDNVKEISDFLAYFPVYPKYSIECTVTYIQLVSLLDTLPRDKFHSLKLIGHSRTKYMELDTSDIIYILSDLYKCANFKCMDLQIHVCPRIAKLLQRELPFCYGFREYIFNSRQNEMYHKYIYGSFAEGSLLKIKYRVFVTLCSPLFVKRLYKGKTWLSVDLIRKLHTYL